RTATAPKAATATPAYFIAVLTACPALLKVFSMCLAAFLDSRPALSSPSSNPPVLAIRSSVRVPRLLVAMPDPLECRECVVEVYCVAFLLILVQHEVRRRVLFARRILHAGSCGN